MPNVLRPARLSSGREGTVAGPIASVTAGAAARVLVYGARARNQLKRVRWPRDNDSARAGGRARISGSVPPLSTLPVCALMRAFRLDNEHGARAAPWAPGAAAASSRAHTRRQFLSLPPFTPLPSRLSFPPAVSKLAQRDACLTFSAFGACQSCRILPNGVRRFTRN